MGKKGGNGERGDEEGEGMNGEKERSKRGKERGEQNYREDARYLNRRGRGK